MEEFRAPNLLIRKEQESNLDVLTPLSLKVSNVIHTKDPSPDQTSYRMGSNCSEMASEVYLRECSGD